uniref:Uncharacterized protein n=1 Tax=Cacopsylla melanoneura TaxID=428564 RepID=A0A8D8W2U6_9HEMI
MLSLDRMNISDVGKQKAKKIEREMRTVYWKLRRSLDKKCGKYLQDCLFQNNFQSEGEKYVSRGRLNIGLGDVRKLSEKLLRGGNNTIKDTKKILAFKGACKELPIWRGVCKKLSKGVGRGVCTKMSIC